MNQNELFQFLLWSLGINYAILLCWFSAIAFARGFVRKVHGYWFNLSDQTFDTVHYSGMAFYKVAIFIFNLAPLLALWIIRGGG